MSALQLRHLRGRPRLRGRLSRALFLAQGPCRRRPSRPLRRDGASAAFTMRTPALLTSLMRGSRRSARRIIRDIHLCTWLLVPADTQATHSSAMRSASSPLSSRLLRASPPVVERWGPNVDAENLYTSQTGGINASLWAVSWTWPFVDPSPSRNISEETLAEGGILLPVRARTAFEGYDSATKVGHRDSGYDHVTL